MNRPDKMRHFFLILLLALTALPAVAQKRKQKQKPIPVPKERLVQPVVIDSNSAEEPTLAPFPTEAPADGIYTVTQEQPEFPGGIPALTAYLSRNLVYPVKAQEAGIQGKVIVRFIVDNEGRLSDAKVMKGIGGGCDEEALRVIRNMPKWKPAKQNGRSVKVYYSQPISFRLIEDEPSPKTKR